jgi:DNA repair protein RecO (recombination protein O)
MIVSTNGIVLKSFRYGETSKIITVFTEDYGKISLIAKGARKNKNKFGGTLDLLKIIKLSFYYKQNKDIFTLANTEYISPLNNIQSTFEHLTASLIIAESLLQSQNINDTNIGLFNLTVRILLILNEKVENPLSFSAYFLIRLAENLGFAMDFEINQDKIYYKNDKFNFSFNKGSFTTGNDDDKYLISTDIALLLSELSCSKIENINKIKIKNILVVPIFHFFKDYFNYHLAKNFKFETLVLYESFL